jgi:HK97 family phage major capsid protein
MTPEEIKAAAIAAAEKEQKALLEKVQTEVKSLVDKGAEATNKEIKAIQDSLKVLEAKSTPDNKPELDKLTKQIEEIGLSVKSMKEEKKEVKGSSLGNLLGNAYKALMFDKDEKFIPMKKGDSRHLELKTVGTITSANVDAVGTDSIPFTLAQYESGLTRIVRRMPFILDLVNLGSTVKRFVQWAEQANPDDGLAAMTGEGQGKHQTDFDIVEKSAEVKKISAYIKVSTEMLDDVDFMKSEINSELIELLRLKLDEQVLKGTGVGVNMSGILTTAQNFNTVPWQDSIFDANRYDVLRLAITQVQTNFFQPNYVVLHPNDLAKMELEKNSTGEYVIYPFSDRVGGIIKGVPIITNTGMTEGDYLVGDFTKARVLMRKDVAISVGWENDDFTKNLVTILGEIRAVSYVKTNYLGAFVTGDFATSIADINVTT